MPSIVSHSSLLYHAAMLLLAAGLLYGVRRQPAGKRWLASAALLGCLAVGLAIFFGGSRFLAARLAAYGLFAYLPLWLAAAALVLRRPCPRVALASVALAGLIVLVGADAFLIEPYWLAVSRYRFESDKIAQPLRVVVVADPQVDAFGDYEQSAFRRAVAERPDLVLLAGDYVQAPWDQQQRVTRQMNEFLRTLPLRAPLGVFAVRGNVDHDDWEAVFQGLDVRSVPETVSLDVGPIRLTCLSCADSFRPRAGAIPAAPGRYHVVLGHSPNFALGDSDAELMLAGHTHGGQIRLPLLGPITTLSNVPRRNACGLSARPAGGAMLVSRGVGLERDDAPRLRLLCRPELVVIDLVPTGHGAR